MVNVKRVERIWRREGLKVPQRQPKKGRLWFHDGSCIRLRPERPNHVWSYDFVESRTHDGRKFRMLNLIDEFTRECLGKFRMLNLIDEFTRECLAIRVDRKLNSTDVIDVPSDQFILRGVPDHIRSDNGLGRTPNCTDPRNTSARLQLVVSGARCGILLRDGHTNRPLPLSNLSPRFTRRTVAEYRGLMQIKNAACRRAILSNPRWGCAKCARMRESHACSPRS